jgi:cyclase
VFEQEGTTKGFDVGLVKAVTDVVSIPVIASGGMGNLDDVGDVVKNGHADAVAMAHVLHYNNQTIQSIRNYCVEQKIPVRHFTPIEDSYE